MSRALKELPVFIARQTLYLLPMDAESRALVQVLQHTQIINVNDLYPFPATFHLQNHSSISTVRCHQLRKHFGTNLNLQYSVSNRTLRMCCP